MENARKGYNFLLIIVCFVKYFYIFAMSNEKDALFINH